MSASTVTETTVDLNALIATMAPGSKVASLRADHKATWTVTRIDRLAGGRSLTIKAVVANPKKAGSAADRNWSLYETGLSVQAFIDAYPVNDGGKGRARTSLAWDLNYGYVVITDANGDVVSV